MSTKGNQSPIAPSTRHASTNYTESAFSSPSFAKYPSEDFKGIDNLAEKRRIQNRIAQRNSRKKLRKRLEELERSNNQTSRPPSSTLNGEDLFPSSNPTPPVFPPNSAYGSCSISPPRSLSTCLDHSDFEDVDGDEEEAHESYNCNASHMCRDANARRPERIDILDSQQVLDTPNGVSLLPEPGLSQAWRVETIARNTIRKKEPEIPDSDDTFLATFENYTADARQSSIFGDPSESNRDSAAWIPNKSRKLKATYAADYEMAPTTSDNIMPATSDVNEYGTKQNTFAADGIATHQIHFQGMFEGTALEQYSGGITDRSIIEKGDPSNTEFTKDSESTGRNVVPGSGKNTPLGYTMSGRKRALYDWDSHFPKMIALYREGRSFPDIYKSIQTPDFQPSEKAVYNKLKQGGWPARVSERASLCKRLDAAEKLKTGHLPHEAEIDKEMFHRGLDAGNKFSGTGVDKEEISRAYIQDSTERAGGDFREGGVSNGKEIVFRPGGLDPNLSSRQPLPTSLLYREVDVIPPEQEPLKAEENYYDRSVFRQLSRGSSIASIADSLFSGITASSISSVKGSRDRGERLVSLFLCDSGIKLACQEGLSRISADRFEKHLRRLLKKFALELQKEAVNHQQRQATHIVQYLARNLAHRICHTLQIAAKMVKRKAMSLEADEISDESGSDRSDDEVDYLEQLEIFLSTSKAMETLRRKLATFVANIVNESQPIPNPGEQVQQISADSFRIYIEHVDKDTSSLLGSQSLIVHPQEYVGSIKSKILAHGGLPVNLQTLLFNGNALENDRTLQDYTIKDSHVLRLEYKYGKTDVQKKVNLLKSWWLWSTNVPAGKTRVSWTCKCGHSSYDDFVELKPGAAHSFRIQMMQKAAHHYLLAGEPNQNFSVAAFTQTLSHGLHIIRSALSFTLGKPRDVELPFHERSGPEAETNTEQTHSQNPTPSAELIYLLLCYDEGRYATRLLQLDLVTRKADSDEALFNLLRTNYKSMRGRVKHYLSLKTLKNIKFVHFEMHQRELIDIRKENALPPPGHADYRYQPAPPELVPPVGERYMMHLFHHPSHADDDSFCLERFPKKLRQKLICKKGVHPGWGLQFVEGWDAGKITLLSLVFLGLGSLLTGILWGIYGHDVQTAFTVATYILAFAAIGVSTLQVLPIM